MVFPDRALQMMRHLKIVFLTVSVGLFGVLAESICALAQENSSLNQRKIEYAISATPIFQFRSDLDGGGDFKVNRYLFQAKAKKPVTHNLTLGLDFSYVLEDYEFSGATAFRGQSPWDNIHSIGLTAPLSYQIKEDWRLFFSPSVGFSRESGADWNEALIYGGVLSVVHRFNRNLTLGFGAGVFDRIEEVEAFPFVLIYWKITERLRLQNPLRAGPAGPAGLELVYTPGDLWELGIGGAYRSFRFRLDSDGIEPNGISEENLVPLFFRASRRLGAHFKLDIHVGAAFGGELVLEDANGNELISDDYESAPFVAFTISWQTKGASRY